jgi:sugar lactone lactonase YvrE
MFRRSRLLVALIAAAGLAASTAAPAAAAPARHGGGSFPTTIRLPNGFQPEGIAIGPGPVAYFGSLADGSIYRVSLRTGEGKVIGEAPGTPSVGMKTDRRGRLFVAGGPAGDARVVDTRTGAVLARYQFATGDTFVNDVVLAYGAAWFTDSLNPVLYKLPLGRHGALPSQAQVERVAYRGELVYQPGFNVNGISRTPDRQGLIVVQSNTASLYRVDPRTGDTRKVDLGAESVPNGDGLLLIGRTLYVVQNRLNTVAKIRLDRAATAGVVVARFTDRRFDVPTTVAAFRDRLYLPNARFGTEATPATKYTAVAIPRF